MTGILRAGPSLWFSGQTKPGGIPRIDWSHPLANKLISYWWDLGTGSFIDLVSGHTTVKDAGGNPPTRKSSPFGDGSGFTANITSVHDPAAYPIQTWAAPYSVAAGWYQLGATTFSSDPGYFGVFDTTGNNGPAFFGPSATTFGCSLANQVSSYSFTYATNTLYVAVASATAASASSHWVNGVAQTAGTTTTAFSGSGLGIEIGSVNYNGANTQSINSIVFFGAIWNGRALNAGEALQLYTDPYCFLLPPEGEMPALFSGAVVGIGKPQGTIFVPGRFGPARGLRPTQAYPLPTASNILLVGVGTYTATGVPIGLPVSKKLAISAGAYTVTGAPVTVGAQLVVSAGAYAVTGSLDTLSPGLNVSAGAYVYSGAAVGLGAGLGVAAGSYAYNGAAVGLGAGLGVAAGSYTYSGATISLGAGLVVPAAAYVYSGAAVTLDAGLIIAAGSYAYTGAAITLTFTPGMHNYTLTVAAGAYTYSGSAVTLAVGMPVAAGGYTYNGAAVGLGAGVGVSAGAYSYNGAAIHFSLGRTVGAGAYSVTGYPLGLGTGLGISSGAYTVIGAAVRLDVGMGVGAAGYSVTGFPVGLGAGLIVSSGSYTYVGAAVGRQRGIGMVAGSGTYAYSGANVQLIYTPVGTHSYTLLIGTGSYTYNGQAVGLVYVPGMAPGASFGVSGRDVACNYGVSGDGSRFGFSNPVYPFGSVVKATDGAVAPVDWTQAFNLPDGTRPTIVLDFVNQQYFDGVTNSAVLASMVSGSPTVDANGMLCNSTTVGGIGALLTALQQPAVSVRAETNLGTRNIVGALVGFQSPYCPLFEDNTNNDAVSGYNSASINSGRYMLDWTGKVGCVAAWDASGRDVAGNAWDVGSDVTTYPFPTTVTIGSTWGTDAFGGYLRNLAVYPVRAAHPVLQRIAWPLPFLKPLTGAHCVVVGDTADYITPGPKLIYERTQPWTCIAGINLVSKPSSASVVFTNVVASPWFGYELFIDANGFMHVRIMGNWGGGGGFIGVYGSINVADGKWHTVAASYDGSSTAAGVKLYFDGVLDIGALVESDSLVSTIISGTPDFWIGNQISQLFPLGPLDNFVMSNIVRSSSYIAANVGKLPAVDASTVLSYAFEEGAGTTTADGSASGFTGTLKNKTSWI